MSQKCENIQMWAKPLIVLKNYREGIIVALDRRFVVYPRLSVAGVDEGAGVEDVKHEVPLLHRPLLHWHLHSMRGNQPV